MKKIGFLSYFSKIIRDLPIRKKLVLSFLLLIIFPVLLIGLFSFYRSSELLKNKTEQYTKDILMETGNNIEVKLQEVERLSFQIVSSTEIQRALNNANKGFGDEYERITAERVIDAQLKGFISSNMDIAAIQVMSYSDITYYVNPASITFNIKNQDKKILEDRNGSTFWFDTNPDTQTIAVGRTINSLVNQDRIGYVFIYLRESSIYNIYKKTELFKSGELFILNGEGRVVSYRDKNILNGTIDLPITVQTLDELKNNFLTFKVNRKNYYITFRTIKGAYWRIVSLIPAVEYEKDIVWLRNWTVLVCISCCLMALIISFGLSNSISKPVRKLSSMMMKVGSGDFNVSSTYESKNEIGILNNHFNKMVAQVQQLIQEVYQEQLLKQKAELKSLRMQINPHFLYNTLESINWMARIKGVPEVGKMVKALGDLMRTSISGDDFVLIDEEITNISNYLVIQKFRYGDRIEVSVDISPEIGMVKIPKLILQPIVENAIVHGIENKVGSGRINIRGNSENGVVVIEVSDNGAGIDQEKAAALLINKGENLKQEGHTHIGLLNVDRRIKMYYGQEYGIVIESSPGCGTCVKIRLTMDTGIKDA